MQRFIVLDKPAGQTSLSALETWRRTAGLASNIPLTYAGRLDPMASGKLLVLIGEECKVKESYLALDKAYEFSVLCGATSDTGDVLGLITGAPSVEIDSDHLKHITRSLLGEITLPYPAFSSKTVAGKPLHTWALEGRLNEITIPEKTSTVYRLQHQKTTHRTPAEILAEVTAKIDLLPRVTEKSKALGQDFRRVDVLASWRRWVEQQPEVSLPIMHFYCVCSSGTYMRTLATTIAKQLGTSGLAYNIHRSHIGRYLSLGSSFGFFTKRY